MTEKVRSAILVNIILYAYCIVLFGYVTYRAVEVSITFDEVSSIQVANSDNWMDMGIIANNHVLNTVFIRCSAYFFEPSEFVYRLPNVLSFILYLVFAVKLGRMLDKKVPYLVVILLTAIPFLLDFFSLARGYGLALSFSLPSIYYCLRYYRDQQFLFGILSLSFGMLSVLSNFSAMNLFLPVVLAIFLKLIVGRKNAMRQLLVFTLLVASFLYVVLPWLFGLKDNFQLYFGGRRSFYHDTILSLSRSFAYHKLNIEVMDVLFVILFCIALLTAFYRFYIMYRAKQISSNDALPIIFVSSILSPIAQHVIFETHFPTERTALIYMPLLTLTLFSNIKLLSSVLKSFVTIPLSIFFLSHLIYSLNYNYVYSWRFDAGTKPAFRYLEKNTPAKKKPVSLGIDYLFNPSTWYYKDAYGLDHLSTEVLIHCGQYDIDLIEFDQHHYGIYDQLKSGITKDKAEEIVLSNKDYYYFHQFMIKELMRHGYQVRVLKKFNYAGTCLMQINDN